MTIWMGHIPILLHMKNMYFVEEDIGMELTTIREVIDKHHLSIFLV